MTWQTEDLAWMAGLFEGEGCIQYTKRNQLIVSVTMTDADVVFGLEREAGIGRVAFLHPQGPRRKPAYKWEVGSVGAYAFLAAIYPWLGRRRSEDARAAMQKWIEKGPDKWFLTHCKRGHPFDEENTYTYPNGRRCCRTCHSASVHSGQRIETVPV